MSVKETKFYEDLGISPSATKREITKAYRKMAMKWHPDKHQGEAKTRAETKFKDITEAYEVLSDDDKRELYNQYGKEGMENGGPQAGGSIFDLFNMGGGGRRGPKRTDDIQFRLGVSLSDFYNGKLKKLKVTRRVLCLDCSGKGSQKPNAVRKCGPCKGRGIRNIIKQVGPGMIQQMRTHCSECGGTGERVRDEDKCPGCDGKKVVPNVKLLEVQIDRGALPGHKVNFFGEAHQEPDHETGDIVVILVPKEEKEVKGKPTFKRTEDGVNLVIEKEITLSEALLGFQFPVTHLDDRIIKIKSPVQKVMAEGDIIVVEGEGMPQRRNPTQTGDLYIKLSIKMPTYNEVKSKVKKIQNALPRPQAMDAVPDDAEEFVATPFDAAKAQAKARARQRHSHAYDEDEQGGGGGQQCRQM